MPGYNSSCYSSSRIAHRSAATLDEEHTTSFCTELLSAWFVCKRTTVTSTSTHRRRQEISNLHFSKQTGDALQPWDKLYGLNSRVVLITLSLFHTDFRFLCKCWRSLISHLLTWSPKILTDNLAIINVYLNWILFCFVFCFVFVFLA